MQHRLIRVCRRVSNEMNVILLDGLVIPFRSSAFDIVISIAVLHHLSTVAHRRHAVKELVRVVKVGGKGLVYAWAQEQSKVRSS